MYQKRSGGLELWDDKMGATAPHHRGAVVELEGEAFYIEVSSSGQLVARSVEDDDPVLVLAMCFLVIFLASAFTLLGLSRGAPVGRSPAALNTSNAHTSLTLLYQNNLNLTDDVNHVGSILLDAMERSAAASACESLSERLLSRETLEAHEADIWNQLAYIAFRGWASADQRYTISDGVVDVSLKQGRFSFSESSTNNASLPVLCTQSNLANLPGTVVANASNEITVESGSNTYVGFRNKKAFRFLGIPFADPPKRFEYPLPYSGSGNTIQATKYGSQCIQLNGGGSENCLFLNIQTPYIPKVGTKNNLRPVLLWIHGGGFTGRDSSEPNTDGSQLASREDIVVVSINYRLSTLGFLAVPGTDIKGNYGIADQIVAMEWIIDNIANFGGDPKKITLLGGSAGAGSIRAHLGSPKSIGKFQGAYAQSNLGGGKDLGLPGNYGTPYTFYYTIEESYNVTQGLFSEIGCDSSAAQAQVDCIKLADAQSIVSASTVAYYVVQDGTYITRSELDLSGPSDNTAHVNVVFGNTANDGASWATYPQALVDNQTAGIMASLNISEDYANKVIESGLFPYYSTGNVTADSFNVSQRVMTDNTFRCIDQATVYAGAANGAFASAYYYQSDRTQGGFNPNGLPGPANAPGYPNGDPYLPYYRLHGSDQSITFGWMSPYREPADLWSEQLSVAYLGAFVRTGNPTPDNNYLKIRDYNTVINGLNKVGPWNKVTDENGPVRHLDWPGSNTNFIDKPQCAWLNYSISYFK